MKEDMVALLELTREMGEKYNAYITVFTFNGENASIMCEPVIGDRISEFSQKEEL